MQKKHIAIYFCTLLLLVVSCAKTVSKPKRTIQFEIEEKGLSEKEKARFITNIQKRLEALGAENVTLETQNGLQISYSFKGDIKPEILEKSFTISGKLEFFEVCKSKKIIYDYLDKKYTSKIEAAEKATITEDGELEVNLESMINFLGIIEPSFNYDDNPIFGHLAKKNKTRAEELLIHKKPVFINELKRRVKFLLGKTDEKDKFLVSALYTTSTNKSPLDGSYVVNAYAEEQYGRYMISLELNKKGAMIWERLTEKAYQERGFIAVVIDDLIYTMPAVTSGPISGGKFEISGNFTKEEATNLALIIASGSIPKVKITKMPVAKDSFPSN